MDINAHPRLDPKLKETYDRIMGTSVGVKPPQHQAAAPAHQADPNPAHATAPASKTVQTSAGHISHIAYNATSAKRENHASQSAIKTDSLLLPLLLGAGGVIFFVFYSIFWMRFFGL